MWGARAAQMFKQRTIPRPAARDRGSGSVGRRELMAWASSLVGRTLKRFDELKDGQAVLLLMKAIWPNTVQVPAHAEKVDIKGLFKWQVQGIWRAIRKACDALRLPLESFPVDDLRRGSWRPCYQLLVMLYFLHNLKHDHQFSAEFAHPIEYKLSEFLQSAECVQALAKDGPPPGQGAGGTRATTRRPPSPTLRVPAPAKRTARKPNPTPAKRATRKPAPVPAKGAPKKAAPARRRKGKAPQQAVAAAAHEAALRQQIQGARSELENQASRHARELESQRQRFMHTIWGLEAKVSEFADVEKVVRADEREAARRELASDIRSIESLLRKEEATVARALGSERSTMGDEAFAAAVQDMVTKARQRHGIALQRIKSQEATIVDFASQIRALRRQAAEARARAAEVQTAYRDWVSLSGNGESKDDNANPISTAAAPSGEPPIADTLAATPPAGVVAAVRVRRELLEVSSRLKSSIAAHQSALLSLRRWFAGRRGTKGLGLLNDGSSTSEEGLDAKADAKTTQRAESLPGRLERLHARAFALAGRAADGDQRAAGQARAAVWEVGAAMRTLLQRARQAESSQALARENAALAVRLMLAERRANHAEAEAEKRGKQLAEAMTAQGESDAERFKELHAQLRSLLKSTQRCEVRDQLWARLAQCLKRMLAQGGGGVGGDAAEAEKAASLEEQLRLVDARGQVWKSGLAWVPDLPAAVEQATRAAKQQRDAAVADRDRYQGKWRRAQQEAATWQEKAATLHAELEDARGAAGKGSGTECATLADADVEGLWGLHMSMLQLHSQAAALWKATNGMKQVASVTADSLGSGGAALIPQIDGKTASGDA